MKKTMIKAYQPLNGMTAHIVTPKTLAEALDFCNEFLKPCGAEYEAFPQCKMPLTALPADVQAEVKSRLKAYSRCNVVFEYNRFTVSCGVCIKSHYNYDHFVCGEYRADEVYTLEERRQNFFDSFGCAPCF